MTAASKSYGGQRASNLSLRDQLLCLSNDSDERQTNGEEDPTDLLLDNCFNSLCGGATNTNNSQLKKAATIRTNQSNSNIPLVS